MGQSAAFFDLDRTLISGASGPAFSHHLAAAGVQRRSLPGTDTIAAAFRVLGETAITAPTARLAARAAAGWPVEAVTAAATAAAEELAEQIQPYAPGVIDEHREAGRILVMATTSPAPLVTPFAELLGFDAVVATQWEVAGRHVHRRHRGAAGVGAGQARSRRGVGHRPRHRPRRLVRLQRQLLRRAAARRRRPPDRRQRRHAPRRRRPPAALAPAPLRPPRRRAQDRRARAAAVAAPAAAARAARQRRHRPRGHRADPAGRARSSPCSTTAATSTAASSARCSGAPVARSASSARRRCSTRR